MALQLFKEQFNGKYDGVTPATLLPVGSIAGGENVRKVSGVGGWKSRKGCSLDNTTALESGGSVLSLHQFTHPRNSDYHFIAQCNSKLLDSPQDPPTASAAGAWTTLESSNVGTTAGFSDIIGEWWFYADGTAAPIMYGGDTPFPIGFLVYDAGNTRYVDYTRVVIDNRTGTLATILPAAGDMFYVGMSNIGEAITLDLTAVNSNAVTLTVKSWVAGAWADRSATDGTGTGGPPVDTCLAQDGSITWTRNSTDEMRVIGGIMAYWYQVTWSGALSGNVTVVSCTTVQDAVTLSNKWDGIPHWVSGCRFYDQSSGDYDECLGKVSNESTSQYVSINDGTTSDRLCIKTPEPAIGFGIGMVTGYVNDANAQIDGVEYWDGATFTAVTAFTDETLDGAADSSFAQTGWVWLNRPAVLTPKMSTQNGDPIPGYWYKLKWDATLATSLDDVRVYIVTYAPYPEALPACDGCIQFKDRLLVWGDPEHPNRLRYSAKGKPDCFSGQDSGFTEAFGDMTKINCCVRFYNELVVFKKNSIWLLEGYGPENFGNAQIADTVGLSSPQTAKAVEVGYSGMHRDEALSILLWQDTDGAYVLDGRKPKKVSLPVDLFFNPEYSTTCIAAASIANRIAFVDRVNNEYHFLLPTGSYDELVYNYVTDEWYPIWNREIELTCGLAFKGVDNRDYVYGGSSAGWVMRLENDTTDKTVANVDKKIDHSIKTRAIAVAQTQSSTLRFTFRRIQIEAKAVAAASITTKTFKDMASTGTTLTTPAAISLANTGYNLVTDHLDGSIENCMAIQIEFSMSTADKELEIYSIMYGLEAQGELGVQ